MLGLVEGRVHALMDEGYCITRMPEFRQEYKQRFGHILDATAAKRYSQTYGVSPVVTANPKPPEPEVKPEPQTNFVPPALMENIQTINESATAAGGYDSAIDLAETIRQVGGVDNFINAVRLLKIVATKPTRTQVAPSAPIDLSGRRMNSGT